MTDLSGKSIPLLVSKLRTAIMSSERSRSTLDIYRRREEIKDELALRGPTALPALMDMLDHPDAATHAADVIGRVGSDDVVVALARLLAEAAPQHSKRAAAKALRGIATPDAVLAVNIWEGRLSRVRDRVTAYVRDRAEDAPLSDALNALAERHRVSADDIADAYLLLTTDETLSLDAQARMTALSLTPSEVASIEAIEAPGQ